MELGVGVGVRSWSWRRRGERERELEGEEESGMYFFIREVSILLISEANSSTSNSPIGQLLVIIH